MPTLAQLKSEIARIARSIPPGGYRYDPSVCPYHGSWAGKEFLGNLLFLDSPITYQVFECPGCGKRDAVERLPHEIDADDPRYIRGAIPIRDWKLRKGVKPDAILEGRVIFKANGEMVEI
jgi:hypothetical protein